MRVGIDEKQDRDGQKACGAASQGGAEARCRVGEEGLAARGEWCRRSIWVSRARARRSTKAAKACLVPYPWCSLRVSGWVERCRGMREVVQSDDEKKKEREKEEKERGGRVVLSQTR